MLYNLTAYLENAARTSPEKIAFLDERESVTFAQLRRRALSAGAYIGKTVGETRRAVAVLTSHTVADVIAFYGALYAGCFYVPIDAEAPQEHIDNAIETAQAALVIDPLAFDPPDVAVEPSELGGATLNESDPAYAIFTSGSTGKPKAAVISHRSVINLTEWLCDTFGFDESTIFGNQTPFYFDASVAEVFCTTCARTTTHILSRKLFFNPLKLLRYLDEHEINTIKWASAAVKLVANSGVFKKHTPQHLKTVLFGGENMTGKHLNIWRRALPDVRYVNVYGPTETTVDCAYYIVEREFGDDESIPIGHAVRNAELLILDGQLAVRGAGVGLGYLGDDERTAAVFVQNPHNPSYRDIIYLTGDLVRRNEYGELVYIGRADTQIKHMGTRVELGEIETVAMALNGIELACCGYDGARDRILLFYQGGAEVGAIADALGNRLPRYMCPNDIFPMASLPQLPNGKIDRTRIMKDYQCSKQ